MCCFRPLLLYILNPIPQFRQHVITFEKFSSDDNCYFCGVELIRYPAAGVGGESKGHFREGAQHPKASCHGNTGHEPIKGFTSSAVHDGRGEREITPDEEPHSSVNEARCDSRESRFGFSSHPKRSQRSDLKGKKETSLNGMQIGHVSIRRRHI